MKLAQKLISKIAQKKPEVSDENPGVDGQVFAETIAKRKANRSVADRAEVEPAIYTGTSRSEAVVGGGVTDIKPRDTTSRTEVRID